MHIMKNLLEYTVACSHTNAVQFVPLSTQQHPGKTQTIKTIRIFSFFVLGIIFWPFAINKNICVWTFSSNSHMPRPQCKKISLMTMGSLPTQCLVQNMHVHQLGNLPAFPHISPLFFAKEINYLAPALHFGGLEIGRIWYSDKGLRVM